MARTIVLVDGEHYPPVTASACAALALRGYEVVGAVMLGGGEKLSGPLSLGEIPVVADATQPAALARGIAGWRPEVVYELSDDPVIDSRARMLLASIALASGVAYEAPGVRFDPPARPRLCPVPSIAVIGTGKRTGKTAVCAALARAISAAGARPVIVSMGRGGPPDPVVVRGDLAAPTVEDLLAVARQGRHAASDCYEDAVCAGVATVGAWRAGAGPAGAPGADDVARAIVEAARLSPEVVLLEGSGTAVPPAAADATILVVGGATPEGEIAGGFGPYRLLLADLVVVTMVEEPVQSIRTLSALASTIRELARDVPIVRTVFRPRPLGLVAGKKTLLATTAPEAIGDVLRVHLEEVHGARVVGITHRLADRSALERDLADAEGTYEVLLTELKAAAVDVAARAARAAGAEVIFADNVPVALEGELEAALGTVWRLAGERFDKSRRNARETRP